ncbi:MAG: hypothetical protein MEQ84_06955 [Mesorhizobium sp.]|nr:hypothetical protein [Mesorhizobium sp.]
MLQELKSLFSPYRLVLTLIAAGLAVASILQDDRLAAAALLAAAFAVAIMGLGYSLGRRAAFLTALQEQLAGVHEHNKLVNQRLELLEAKAASGGSSNVADRLDAIQALIARSVDHTLALNQSLDELSASRGPDQNLVSLAAKLDQLHGLMELSIDSIGAQRIDISDLRQGLIHVQSAYNNVDKIEENVEEPANTDQELTALNDK